MSKSHQKIIVHLHPDIADLPYIEQFKQDFETYKGLAFQYASENDIEVEEFLPASSEADQKAYPPDHSFFGRDRLFLGGWSGYRFRHRSAEDDALYHVHLYQENNRDYIWHDPSCSIVLAQWDCTSDAALIYSYINDLSGHFNFLLLEIIDPGAHQKYEQDGVVAGWRKKASDYWTYLGISN